MEGLRAVAVFLVFWVHYSALIQPWITGSAIPISAFIKSFGHLGVDLFFVLSGYLIYGSIIDKSTFAPAKYGKRRIQRIYPTFSVVLATYVVLSFLFPAESKFPDSLADKLVYLAQNLLLLPGIFDIDPIITVAWSLSYEVFYYIAIPIVILLLKMKAWRVETRVLFWSLVLVLGFAGFSLFGGPVRLMMFIVGILLFELYTKKDISLKGWGTTYLLVALFLFGFGQHYGLSFHLLLFVVSILFLLLCLCAFNPNTHTFRWLTLTPVRWLGNMSFSYYLVHALALKFFFLVFGLLIPSEFVSYTLYYWLWIPFFAMTIVPSFVLFWIVERPLSLK